LWMDKVKRSKTPDWIREDEDEEAIDPEK
jgi:hypothetical protein